MNSPVIEPDKVIITKSKKKRHVVSITLCLIYLLISSVAYFAANWYDFTCGNVGFDAIMFTLLSNLDGAQATVTGSYLLKGLLPAILSFAAIGFVLFFFPKKKDIAIKIKKFKLKLFPIKHGCAVAISLILSTIMLFTAAHIVSFSEYLYSILNTSKIFEEEYVDPMAAGVEFPEEKRNLIYIFLESIETTYLSEEQGGGLKDRCIMPELYDLANKNINFSHNDGVGGFVTPNGTTWTAAAMAAQTSGIPLKAPASFERNAYGADSFLPGANSITTLLKEHGYYQTLMVGSDATFANRDVYFKDHGIDKIYDLYTAQEDGIVPEGYHVWWGMEDKYLFKYAQQELTKIAAKDQPFAFTMLTVDTHFTNGYICDLCDDEYEEQYDNVISCSSKQVAKFVKWIQRQSFYKDTTIVIVGDHLTMDSEYIQRNVDSGYDQRVYNCIINSAVPASDEISKNREFCTLDMFPTTIAAMGGKIPGERLGLGTNLFSDTPTLVEEMGFKKFNEQIYMNSKYYMKNFLN